MDNIFRPSTDKSFSSLVDYVEKFFVQVLFRVVFGLALFFFLLNVYRFIRDAGNAEKRKGHQKGIFWSLIAMAAMFSVWALVSIVTGTFNEPAVLPQIDAEYLDSFH